MNSFLGEEGKGSLTLSPLPKDVKLLAGARASCYGYFL